jgi:hypothetical protein
MSKRKDHRNAREDFKELGIRLELYAEETKTGTNLPVVATTSSKADRKELCQFLHDLKVPLGYSSDFKRLVSVKDMKMNFNLMKSHDCHVLMIALVPVALRGIKIELVATRSRACVYSSMLCLLEATFPPSFFDLMLHLTAHLVREIWFLGPSQLHQMLP